MSHAALLKVAPKLPVNLVLYDGVCHYSKHQLTKVLEKNFLREEGSLQAMHFATRQSREGLFVASHLPKAIREMDTLVVIERRASRNSLRKGGDAVGLKVAGGGQMEYTVDVYVKSSAIFRVMMKLDNPAWAGIGAACYYGCPRFLANLYYDRVTASKYGKYGKAPGVIAPTAEMKYWTWKMK
jgi:predicted DCC family thiol-disulfide oxidoreductase YuxK